MIKNRLVIISIFFMVGIFVFTNKHLISVQADRKPNFEVNPSIVSDIVPLTLPQQLGKQNLSPEVSPLFYTVTADANYAYAITHYDSPPTYPPTWPYSGLWIIDFFTAGSPTLLDIGQFGMGNDIIKYGNYIFMADDGFYPPDYSLKIIDATDPLNLSLVGTLYAEGKAQDVKIQGNYAYLAIGDYPTHGLAIVDISNLASPTLTSFLEYVCMSPEGLAVRDNYVYLVGECGLTIVDVTNPSNPFKVGGPPSNPDGDGGCSLYGTDIDLRDDIAFLTVNNYPGDESGTICSIDISDPTNPIILDIFPIENDGAFDLVLTGDYGFVAEGTNGIGFMDLTDPNNLISLAQYDTSGKALDLALDGYNLYLADYDGGLLLYPLDSYSILNSINGFVLNEDGLPISGAAITVNEISHTTVTDSDGKYKFDYLTNGNYTVTPFLPGHIFYPPHQIITLPPNAHQIFTMLPTPVATTLTPGISADLSFFDSEGLETQISFPANAVTQTLTAVLTPTMATYGPEFAFTGHAVELAVYANNLLLPNFVFNAPITVTLNYSSFDVRLISDELLLTLQQWVSSTWQDAGESCTPTSAYNRDIENNFISVEICTTGKLALFGPTNPFFLPLLFRDN